MTQKERLEKIISERKNPLLIDNKVKRLTPKSEFLKGLELNQRMSKCKDSEIINELLGFCAEQHMIDVFTGSDLGHFSGSNILKIK